MNKFQQERINFIEKNLLGHERIIEFGYGHEIFNELLKFQKEIIVIENDDKKIIKFNEQNYFNAKIIKGDFYKVILKILKDNDLITCMTFNQMDILKNFKLINTLAIENKFENLSLITFRRNNGQEIFITKFTNGFSSFFKKYVNNKELKNLYFNLDFLKNSNFEFINDTSLIFFNDVNRLHVCGDHNFRSDYFGKIYNFLKEFNINNIVEIGIGLYKNREALENCGLDFKIIEINKKLFEYYLHNNFIHEENILNMDFYKYIKTNIFYNTAFIVRQPVSEFKNLESYILYIKKNFLKHTHKNNILVIEKGIDNFVIPNCLKKIFHEGSVATHTYFIKL